MNRPLVWVALSFIGGTLAAAYGWLPHALLGLALLGLALGLAVTDWGARRGRALTVALAFVGAGALLWHARQAEQPGDALSCFLADEPRYLVAEGYVRTSDLLLPGEEFSHFILEVDRVSRDGGASFEALPGRTQVRWIAPGQAVYPGQYVQARGRALATLSPVNPGIQSVEDYLRRHGTHSQIRAEGPQAVSALKPAPGWWIPHWAARLRSAEARLLERACPEAALPLIYAVWLGDRGGIQSEAYRAYVHSGTAHILAVSGLHMSIVYLSLSAALRLLTKRRKARVVLTLAAVLLFALVTGARISSLRAALMLALYLSAEYVNREPDAPTALGLSATIFTLANPLLLFDGGFQLSFLSVASILLFSDRIAARVARLARLPHLLRDTLAPTLAAQILPVPAAIALFHVFPAIGLLANLAVVPLLGVVLWLTSLTVASGLIVPGLEDLFGHALAATVYLMEALVNAAAVLPFSHVYLTTPQPLALVCYAALVALLAFPPRTLGRAQRAVAALLLLAGIAAAWHPWRQPPELVFLDVGDGDATFIRAPGGQTVLVDGGDRRDPLDLGERIVAPFLWARGVTQLDYVFATHPDRDHIGGLFYVLDHFSVGQVVLGLHASDRPLEAALLERCAARAIPVTRAGRGDRIALGGMTLEVLHPDRAAPPEARVNDLSLVMRVVCGETRILLPGDIEATAERALLGEPIAAQVMRAPHHGRSTSSSAAFLDTVAPATVIVSSAHTPPHPGIAPGVAQRLEARGSAVWRTDQLGGIRLSLDGPAPRISSTRIERRYVTPARNAP